MNITEVLIADDSVLILKIVKKALLNNSILGYHFTEEKIYTAQNGMEAFEILGKNKNISLLISDINMPILNGDELIEVLLDTGRHKSIKTAFITSSESQIKSSTKKHTIGTIKKPFNSDTFNVTLNDLLKKDEEKRETHTKQIIEQKSSFKEAITKLYEHFEISNKPKEDHLEKLLESYLNSSEEMDKAELELLFYTLVDELFESSKITPPSKEELQHFYHISSKEKISYLLGLQQCFDYSILNTKTLIEEKKEIQIQLIVKELLENLQGKISILKQKVIKFPKKNHSLLAPQIKHLVGLFEQIDPVVHDEYLDELESSLQEIDEFCEFLNTLNNKNYIQCELEQIKNKPQLLTALYERYQNISHSLKLMQNYIIGEKEEYLLYRAMRSKKITMYLKKSIPSQLPTTNNILLHLQKITPLDHKRLIRQDSQKIAVLSKDMELLKFFKEEYEKLFPTTTIFCFTKVSIFESWLPNKNLDKLIVDYQFEDNIFNNGTIVLKYFLKKYRKKRVHRSLFKYQRYYIVISSNEIMKEREILNKLDPHIIERPLCKNSLKSILVYS